MLPSSIARLAPRLVLWGAVTLALVQHGCDEPGPSLPDLRDMSKPPADMRQTCDGSVNTPVDLGSAGTGRTIKPGDIGSPCTKDGDCLQGSGQRVCFKSNLLNNAKGAATPGGYCSALCGGDTDCGAENYCLSFPPSAGAYCVAGCKDAVTCRKTDYLCMFLDTVSACLPRFPSMTCNPTDPTTCKTVLSSPAGLDGGCIRQAYEDDRSGICYPTCKLGATCPQDSSGATLSCRYLSSFPTGDRYAGNLCLPSPNVTPKPEGSACLFADECQDGLQCDRPYVTDSKATQRCRKLCDLGASQSDCPTGQACSNVFGTCSGAGLCRPL